MSTTPETTGGDPFSSVRGESPAPRSHTHLSKLDIIRHHRISTLERFLLWLAKTDLYVLHVVPNNCRNHLVSLGMMVLFTTTLAFFSSFYTIKTTLLPPDLPASSQAILGPANNNAALKQNHLQDAYSRQTQEIDLAPDDELSSEAKWILAGMVAVVYAFGILIIDREIVGAISNSALSIFLRFIFAVCIATAISWPVKLKFFEGRVNIEVDRMVDENNQHRYDTIADLDIAREKLNKQIDALSHTRDKVREQQRTPIQERLASDGKLLSVLNVEIEKESQIGHCGPKCQGLITQRDDLKAKMGEAEAQLSAFATAPPLSEDSKLEIARKQNELEKLEPQIRRLRAEIAHEHEISYDFLTKWEALDRIKRKMPDYKVLSTFILLFFMLLEMIPLGLKWSLGKTEYQYYLEARTHLNNQKIISLANLHMEKMQGDRRGVLDTPIEITDLIASTMEDESRESVAPIETRSLSDLIEAGNVRRGRGGEFAPLEGRESGESRRDGGEFTGARPPSTGFGNNATVDEEEPQR